MKQLITIEKITALYSIPNTDFIETAQVLVKDTYIKN